MRQPLGAAAAVVLVLFALAAATAPWISPFDPNAINLRAMQQPPNAAHWLGTDDLGRDFLARMLYAGRISLLLAGVVTALAVVLGMSLGALAGYFGGWIDRLVSLATDSLLSLPVLGLAMVAGSVLRPNLWTLAVVLALVSWPTLGRITRAQMLTLRERTYAEAAIATGMAPRRVLYRHLLPNALAPLIRQEYRGFHPSRSSILRQLNTESNGPWPGREVRAGP
jgi:peptide/nickel transport system permease protein